MSLSNLSLPSTKTALISSAIAISALITSYSIYFDYRRRNDAAFRKNLYKQNKKLEKTNQRASVNNQQEKLAALQRALIMMSAEEPPVGAQAQEQYFMEQVALGEQLAARDHPDFQVAAATSFYKALRVYPNPEELLNIYQKTQPPAVFELVMMMLQLEGSMPRRTSPLDPRDISTSALLTEIEPEVPTTTTLPPTTTASENGSEEASTSSPPSTGSFVHVEEEPEAVVVVAETEVVEFEVEAVPVVVAVVEERVAEVEVEEKKAEEVEEVKEPVVVVAA